MTGGYLKDCQECFQDTVMSEKSKRARRSFRLAEYRKFLIIEAVCAATSTEGKAEVRLPAACHNRTL
jgi:hypothetical protein